MNMNRISIYSLFCGAFSGAVEEKKAVFTDKYGKNDFLKC